ncbi:CYTH domain-containing protein [Intrasporangium chromatireducens]|nr:CYTH domain-containing protein [Intrasporangium chromatireducens]
MGRRQQEETERKYDVDAATVFPNLADTSAVDSVGQPGTFLLEAVYFATPRLDLARNGVTLRRRTGGHDEGWHLKIPAGQDIRTELREPLGSGRTVPEVFRARVHAIARGRTLEPVATVRTERREYPLRDAEGGVLAVAADDNVRALRLGGGEEVHIDRDAKALVGVATARQARGRSGTLFYGHH